MTVSKVKENSESLGALRLTKPHPIGYGFVDVASSITVRMPSQMTQDGVMENRLRRKR